MLWYRNLSELWSHTCDKGCSADSTRSGSISKTSFGRVSFHQYHVISPGFCMGFSTTDSMKISVAFSCILHHSFFCDSLSSDNIACSKPSAGKTKSPISGAIDTAERKKSEARVQSGKEQRSPGSTSTDLDTTRADPTLVFSLQRYYRAMHHFRSVLLNGSL